MKGLFYLIAGSLALIVLSCDPMKNELLVGQWQAFEILEEGETLSIDPAEITITFSEDESYTYKSTLNYQEAGNYYIDSKYLFTMDTVNQASTEKAVEILQLSPDSLVLKMNEGTKERILKLIKVSK